MPIHKLIDGELRPYAGDSPIEVTLAAWRDGARPNSGRCALLLPNDVPVAEVAEALDLFDAVILEFPVFKDGRAYSQARLLRERYGFKGELRARGHVLRDQALFMRRAGFDAFEIDEGEAASFREAFAEQSFVYQAAADGAEPVWRSRAARAAAA
ncbi:MAG: DUF934 domain-containing protein [Amphiplicatus sp.]